MKNVKLISVQKFFWNQKIKKNLSYFPDNSFDPITMLQEK